MFSSHIKNLLNDSASEKKELTPTRAINNFILISAVVTAKAEAVGLVFMEIQQGLGQMLS